MLPDLFAEWPLYITDDGIVQCYAESCVNDNDWEVWTPAYAGRRTTVAGLTGELHRHIVEGHGVDLPIGPGRSNDQPGR